MNRVEFYGYHKEFIRLALGKPEMKSVSTAVECVIYNICNRFKVRCALSCGATLSTLKMITNMCHKGLVTLYLYFPDRTNSNRSNIRNMSA